MTDTKKKKGKEVTVEEVAGADLQANEARELIRDLFLAVEERDVGGHGFESDPDLCFEALERYGASAWFADGLQGAVCSFRERLIVCPGGSEGVTPVAVLLIAILSTIAREAMMK